jgi:hypothetical protein
MITVTIDVTIFNLSAYDNAKMDSFEFLGNGERPYILWSPMTTKFQTDGDYAQLGQTIDNTYITAF